MNKGTILVIALLKINKVGNSKVLKYIVDNNYSYDNCLNNVEKICSKNEFELLLEQASNEVKKNYELNIKSISIFDNEYPSKLYTITDPILYLYYIGNINLLTNKSVAIIGTRKPSEYAIQKTIEYTTAFIKRNIVVVSGLALGIDTVAHNTCINNNGLTIAVMPTGLDNIQPTSNKELARQIIINNGCIISEYSIGTPLNKFNYAKRDRIQSALSNAILVTEAAEKSGTMIAVNKNLKEQKPVYQDINNDNNIIKNKVDLNDSAIDEIIKAIDLDKLMEKSRKDKLDIKNTKHSQLTLF